MLQYFNNLMLCKRLKLDGLHTCSTRPQKSFKSFLRSFFCCFWCSEWEHERFCASADQVIGDVTGERNFNVVSHKPTRAPIQFNSICSRQLWFMGYGIKISFPRPPQWRHRSPGTLPCELCRYSKEDTRKVSVPSLLIGIPVLLSFFINIISVGSLCYLLRNFISTLIHRVRSLCYCTLHSKLLRVVSEQIKTEERDFRFWQRQKSQTAQKRLLRRLMILSFVITFTVWKACATGFHPPTKATMAVRSLRKEQSLCPWQSQLFIHFLTKVWSA